MDCFVSEAEGNCVTNIDCVSRGNSIAYQTAISVKSVKEQFTKCELLFFMTKQFSIPYCFLHNRLNRDLLMFDREYRFV